MINSGKLVADELPNCLIDKAGFNHSKYQMSVYSKYVPDFSKFFVLSYGHDCIYGIHLRNQGNGSWINLERGYM